MVMCSSASDLIPPSAFRVALLDGSFKCPIDTLVGGADFDAPTTARDKL